MNTALAKIRVLIVDDCPADMDRLQRILRANRDIKVVGGAFDGLDALAKAHRRRPDVVLLDAQMPNMDGVDATYRIKGQLPDVKVLFLAEDAMSTGLALAAGADDVLMKDCPREELLAGVKRLARMAVPPGPPAPVGYGPDTGLDVQLTGRAKATTP